MKSPRNTVGMRRVRLRTRLAVYAVPDGHSATGTKCRRPPQTRSTSNAVTLRVSLLNSTPIRWTGSPDPLYLSA